MNVCPIGVRYGREQILSIFEEGARLNAMLKVEAALAQCQAKYGIIPKEAARDIEKAVTGGMVKSVSASPWQCTGRGQRRLISTILLPGAT